MCDVSLFINCRIDEKDTNELYHKEDMDLADTSSSDIWFCH